MRFLSEDTCEEAHAIHIALLRNKSPGERMMIAHRIRQSAEAMAMSRLVRQYPNDPPRTLQLGIAALRYGDEVVKRVFVWDPELEGR